MHSTAYLNPPTEIGCPIPAYSPHAISVTLPTWQDNVDYEEARERVVSRMSSGPDTPTVSTCARLAELSVLPPEQKNNLLREGVTLHVVLFPKDAFPVAKLFWQHTGDGISSRLAEYALCLMQAKQNEHHIEIFVKSVVRSSSFKKRYANPQLSTTLNSYNNSKQISPTDTTFSENSEVVDERNYVEERYGRNLPISLADKAKIALKRRIAGVLGAERCLEEVISGPIEPADVNERGVKGITENDVYLFPTGCHFFGHGSPEDIDSIERLLISGERILALFCEFPSNPLCKSPDLKRLRTLADKYDFLIVVDETIGNFVNVKVLEWADIMVSSLTKIFSGEVNVMGGGLVLNPRRRHYDTLKKFIQKEYEDLLWREDAIVLERNSRTFCERIYKVNENTEKVCDFLCKSPKVKKVYYPKYIDPEIYLQYKTTKGGYGGLFSVTFHSDLASRQFFDALQVAKGPSLGTNVTLACPYTILAHYFELDWALSYGVEFGLVRVSIGLEDIESLLKVFQEGLDAICE
ncbi:6573_t:CDS:2 [Acaulospora colombiana]|uniref:6573_t:CDS:1 n=1 Tax=Acaulospora colombiana TaxID=27376 RepID=A0ACA9LUJ1_9GLOM|nr:6573_t:CDS:2 [Acaulospora colombiana]